MGRSSGSARRRPRRTGLRWVLVHLVEEPARHAGPANIVRELIDGTTGDHGE